LDEHQWQYLTCGEEAAGAWAPEHVPGECRNTEVARAFVDGVAGVELMRQLAYDPALVQRVWRRWKDTWREMLRGQAWQGLTGRVGVRLPGSDPVPRAGVGVRDGEPAVFSREEQAEAQRRWKTELDGAKVEGEGSGPPARVDVAVDGSGVQVLPMTLFLLFERPWRQHTGGPEGFPEAVRGALWREQERAEAVVDRRRVGNDTWAWPGGFVDWMVLMRRQAQGRTWR
jgi:hypothetical protein